MKFLWRIFRNFIIDTALCPSNCYKDTFTVDATDITYIERLLRLSSLIE